MLTILAHALTIIVLNHSDKLKFFEALAYVLDTKKWKVVIRKAEEGTVYFIFLSNISTLNIY